jgi:hypothetical protein
MTDVVNPGAEALQESASSPYESGNLSDLLEAEGTVGESRTQFLTPRELMVLRFRRNRIAVLALWFLAFLYLAVLFAPIVAPYDRAHRSPSISISHPGRSISALTTAVGSGLSCTPSRL